MQPNARENVAQVVSNLGGRRANGIGGDNGEVCIGRKPLCVQWRHLSTGSGAIQYRSSIGSIDQEHWSKMLGRGQIPVQGSAERALGAPRLYSMLLDAPLATLDEIRFAMTSPQLAALADAFVRCRDLDAPLNERLDAYSSAVRKFIPSYADAVDRLVARLSGSHAGVSAPQPRRIDAEVFVLPDETELDEPRSALLRMALSRSRFIVGTGVPGAASVQCTRES